MGKGSAERGLQLNYDEDENKSRGNWTGRLDFILSTVGFAVGLGNIWRFPYKAYENGGASFLVPYLVFLVVAGLPMFFMELSFGQFASLGPITIWRVAPVFKGLGWAMVLISAMVCVYYNMIIAYTLYYLFASMRAVLPWQNCWDEWKRINDSGKLSTCVTRGLGYAERLNQTRYMCDSHKLTNDVFNSTDDYLYNCTARPVTPSALYWSKVVLDESPSINEGADEYRWQLVLCLLGAWILVFLCMCRGIKSSGKVVYFTAIFPYVVLIILLVKNTMLEGAITGIEFYIYPNATKLSEPGVWYAAANQIFYSLGIAFGGLMTMSSYNRFHNNVYRDSILVACINCGTSIFAGFVIFSVIGHMSTITGLPISEVVDSGPGLAFVAYPEGIATMPIAPLWAVLFFLMILTLGLDSQFAMMETVVTAIADEFELNKKRHGKTWLTLAICVVLFLIGLPQCSRAGIFIMNLFDSYSASFQLMVVSFLEVVAIAWVYGFHNFKKDIQMMVGTGCWINASFYYYWFPTWIIITPAMLLFILVYAAMHYSPIEYKGQRYPEWAEGIGFLMVGVSLVFIPLIALVEYCKAHSFIKVLRKLFRPRADWGPALANHRGEDLQRYSYDNSVFASEPGGYLSEFSGYPGKGKSYNLQGPNNHADKVLGMDYPSKLGGEDYLRSETYSDSYTPVVIDDPPPDTVARAYSRGSLGSIS